MNVDLTKRRDVGRIPHICNDADDGHELWVTIEIAKVDAAANRVLPAPHRIGDCFADDSDLRRCCTIGFVKNTSAKYWNIHCLEVSRRCDMIHRPIRATGAPSLNTELPIGGATGERQLLRSADCYYLRYRREPAEQFFVPIRIPLAGIKLAFLRKQNIERDTAFRLEPQIDLQNTKKT